MRFGFVAGFILFAVSANGHPVAQGSMGVEISPGKIHIQARVSMEEVFVQNALSSGSNEGNVGPDDLCRRHGDYLLQHLFVFADGTALPGSLTSFIPPQKQGVQRAVYELEYNLPTQPAQIRITENVLNEFDYAPGNRWEATYVVRLVQPGRPPVEGLLLTSRESLVVDCQWTTRSPDATSGAATLDKWRLTTAYIRHGIAHILTGYDHLLFIGGLVLAVVTLWDLVKVITAFTLAHSITLTLSVLNIVRLSEKIVEPMIAASIVFVALQNIFWPQRSRGATRLGVAFFFGLFHGLGFAGGLLAAMEGMAGLTVGLAIVAFSAGVEIGHQVVVLPLFGALKILRWRGGKSARLAEYLFRYGSAAICAAGLFYLFAALRYLLG